MLGFALKAGKTATGTDAIIQRSRSVSLIVVCRTLQENALKKIVKAASGTPIIRHKTEELSAIIKKTGVKAIGVTDTQMAQAIDNFLDEQYERLTEVGHW